MASLHEVRITPRSIARFAPIIGEDSVRAAASLASAAQERHPGRTIWNINSTAAGGGVAEMLPSLLGYARGLGLDARWMVIEGSPEFFTITKRLHHALHGSAGDGSALDQAQHGVYGRVLHENARELTRIVKADDVVILHDPQTAGLSAALMRAGARVIWRCHVGQDVVNAEVERGWLFLERYLRDVPTLIFSRREYIPSMLAGSRTVIVPPSIDPFTAKNEPLAPDQVRAILARAGLVGASGNGPVTFRGADGTERHVERHAAVVRADAPPPFDAPLIVQVSRWDPLKDPEGVMMGFAALVNDDSPLGSHLLLAGPETRGVVDDPESALVLERTIEAWRSLPAHARRRIHLASLPTVDTAENATIVNALQQHATVVVQKSLHEGFGLTVTEAMWKARPVVASAVGGIQDQISDREHGRLLRDPRDLHEYGATLLEMIEDREPARRMGEAARERVRERYLTVRHLTQYLELLDRLDARS